MNEPGAVATAERSVAVVHYVDADTVAGWRRVTPSFDQLADAVVAERSRRVLPWHSGLSEEGLSEEGWSEDGWSEDGWSEETDE